MRAKALVHPVEHVPEGKKLLLRRRQRLVGRSVEALPEARDQFPLLGGQVVVARVQHFEVAQVSEQVVGPHQALVDLVEVFQQQLAPEIEPVEGFIGAALPPVDLVEHEDERELVGRAQVGQLGDELGEGEQARRPARLVDVAAQDFAKEQPGPPVGKHHGEVGQVALMFAQELTAHFF